jgi:hypothetical protein
VWPANVELMRWAVLCTLAGCYNPKPAPGAPCESSNECPSFQPCVANVCGGTEAAADAGHDAPRDAPSDAPNVVEVVIGTDKEELRDTEIWGANPGTNYGGVNQFGIDDSESGLLWFDLTQVPTNKTVVSATLAVTTSNDADKGGGTVTIHRLREAWVENEATWVARASTQSWSASGARPPASDEAVLASFSPDAVETAYAIALPPALVQDWVSDPLTNFGIVFVRGTSTQHVHIHTRESTTWSRLVLEIY